MFVSLTAVHACVFATLALLVGAIRIGMRNESAFSWIVAALLCGTTEMLVLALARHGQSELIAAMLLVPPAYLCFSQAVRISVGGRQQWRLIGASVALVGCALVLRAVGAPFVVMTIPFQLGCALALGDGILHLARRPKGVVDRALLFCLAVIAGVFLVRIPLYPALFGVHVAYATIMPSMFERSLLLVSALLTPPSIFLLLAKIIGGVIAQYRLRSERDHLTGVLNRQTFEAAVRAEPLRGGAVIYSDIDKFKRINDRYGHHIGDEVIRQFADILAGTGFRVGRLGGEEFALFLPGNSAADAAGLAEVLRMHFHNCTHEAMAPDHRLSASFGVADYAPGEPPAEALIRADVALYRAKGEGRNRVAIFHAWGMMPVVQEPPRAAA
ncbi:GGDEF domain-containing protein [Sphingomonas sp. HITSZ_GF]|uniref:GGDEF domain-containing protein n=1 Tax=Sphingomonas sp. HITSZ_GF TaxID=3037247 RepID=UPI00240D11AB|nr:GGDEF domain-containing protein [Sphingomonas sp. HITSZ_GF]MDG2532245.1 GGDEF domain-containing protein [Sphingomonas sp. HITSZ_GF]